MAKQADLKPIKLPAIHVTEIAENHVRAENYNEARRSNFSSSKLNSRSKLMSISADNFNCRSLSVPFDVSERSIANEKYFDSLRKGRSVSFNDVSRDVSRDGFAESRESKRGVDKGYLYPGRSPDQYNRTTTYTNDKNFERLLNRRRSVSDSALYSENASSKGSRMADDNELPCPFFDEPVDKTYLSPSRQRESVDKCGRSFANKKEDTFNSFDTRRRTVSFDNGLYGENVSVKEPERRPFNYIKPDEKKQFCAFFDVPDIETTKGYAQVSNKFLSPLNVISTPGFLTNKGKSMEDLTSLKQNTGKPLLPSLKIGSNYRIDNREFCYRITNPKEFIEDAIVERKGFCWTNMNLKKKKSPPPVRVTRPQYEEDCEVKLEAPLFRNGPASCEFKEIFYENSDYCIL